MMTAMDTSAMEPNSASALTSGAAAARAAQRSQLPVCVPCLHTKGFLLNSAQPASLSAQSEPARRLANMCMQASCLLGPRTGLNCLCVRCAQAPGKSYFRWASAQA